MTLPVNKSRIFGLDLMRAVAIIAVLLGHLPVLKGFSDNVFVKNVLALSAFWGVEIFFVLSGFLIGRILIQKVLSVGFGGVQLLHFLKRRWFRTLPNYFLVLIINLFLGWWMGFEMQNITSYFVFAQNLWVYKIGFFTESWSLSVEEWAYLLLALSLWALHFFKGFLNKGGLLFLFVLLWMIFWFNKLGLFVSESDYRWNEDLKSVVIYRIDAILIGVVGAWWSVFFPASFRMSRLKLMVLGFAMLLFLSLGLSTFGLTNQQSFFWTVIYLPITSCAFFCFLPVLFHWKDQGGLVAKSITFVSKISYAAYLLHYSILLYLFNLFSPFQGFINVFLYLTCTLFLSYILYRFYERPLMNLRDKF